MAQYTHTLRNKPVFILPKGRFKAKGNLFCKVFLPYNKIEQLKATKISTKLQEVTVNMKGATRLVSITSRLPKLGHILTVNLKNLKEIKES